MPKGKRSGKEARKPKKPPAPAAIPAVPGQAKPANKGDLPRWPKK